MGTNSPFVKKYVLNILGIALMLIGLCVGFFYRIPVLDAVNNSANSWVDVIAISLTSHYPRNVGTAQSLGGLLVMCGGLFISPLAETLLHRVSHPFGSKEPSYQSPIENFSLKKRLTVALILIGIGILFFLFF